MLSLIISAVGAVLFLFSDTLFGDSDIAYNLMLLGLILFPVGVILAFVGIVELLFAKIKQWIAKKLHVV